jgi:hypothetical protein
LKVGKCGSGIFVVVPRNWPCPADFLTFCSITFDPAAQFISNQFTRIHIRHINDIRSVFPGILKVSTARNGYFMVVRRNVPRPANFLTLCPITFDPGTQFIVDQFIRIHNRHIKDIRSVFWGILKVSTVRNGYFMVVKRNVRVLLIFSRCAPLLLIQALNLSWDNLPGSIIVILRIYGRYSGEFRRSVR